MKWLLLLILLVALIVVLVTLLSNKKKKPAETFVDLADLKPTDADRGDTVSVLAMGENYDDLDFVVDRINRYEADGERWSELSGEYRGGRVFLELYEDDGLEITLTRPQDGIDCNDLPLGEADLIRFDESQTGSFAWADSDWAFEESGELIYFEDGRGSGEGYYNWSFRETGAGGEVGERYVFVEKWEGEAFEAMLGSRVRPGDVRVFRA